MVSSIGESNCPRSKQHLNVIEATEKCNILINCFYSGFLNCKNNKNIVADVHKYTKNY